MVGHLEGLKLPLEHRVVSERAVEVQLARIPPGPARVADDLVGDGVHGIGHALNRLQPKSHDWWSRLPRPVVCLRSPWQRPVVTSLRRIAAVSPGLLHTLAPSGRQHGQWSSGRQWRARTVPRRHRWSARRGVRPRASALRLMSRTGWWVGIFFPAPGRLSILLTEATADVLTTDTGPVVLIASVSSPASLRACLGRRHVL